MPFQAVLICPLLSTNFLFNMLWKIQLLQWNWSSGLQHRKVTGQTHHQHTSKYDKTINWTVNLSQYIDGFMLKGHNSSANAQELYLFYVNTLRPKTKWTPFRRRYFQMHFIEWNVSTAIKNSLRFVPKGPINNIPALVQIMAWRRPGNKPLSEPMMVS